MTRFPTSDDLARIELEARRLRAESVRALTVAAVARLRALFAPRPAARAA